MIFFGSITLLSGVAVLVFLKEYKIPGRFLLTLGAMALGMAIWNYAYLEYTEAFSYSRDVFRGVYNNFHSPLYGFIQKGYFSNIPFIVIGIVFAATFWILRNQYDKVWMQWFPPAFMIILIFSYHNSIYFLPTHYDHYQTFSEGLHRFQGFREILRFYTERMGLLGGHNSHYPPGNLMLLMLEQRLFPGFAKLVISAAVIFSFLPLKGILNILKVSNQKQLLILLMYATCPALTIFPAIAMTPLMVALASLIIFFFMRTLLSQSFASAVFLGFSVALFTFFNFSFSLLVLWCGLLFLLMIFDKEIEYPKALLSIAISILTFLLCFTLMYFLFDFDILATFTQALENNSQAMTANSFDTWRRFLIRSSGNFISFFFITGIPAIALFLYRFNNQSGRFSRAISIATFGTIILAAFSGLFFMETERIWLCLIPCILVSVPGNFEENYSWSLPVTIIFLALSLLFFSNHFVFYL